MPPIYLNKIGDEIEMNIKPKVGSKTVMIEKETLEEYMAEPEYNKLQAELQEKYGFLFKEKVRETLK